MNSYIEVETRILKILYDSELADINDFSFNQDIRKDLNLDSLSITVLISSIEEEFSTIFDEDVYEDCKNLGEVVDILIQD